MELSPDGHPGNELIRIHVKYVFGILVDKGPRERTLEVAAGSTVLEVLRALDLSRIELLAVVNGEMVSDQTILCDGDELTVIPAIQGG